MKEQTIIVNENDEIIYHKERSTLNEDEIFRISALWITNSKNEILLAKRSLKKEHNPGKWGPAVTGINAKDETYEKNIIKEAEEELGLKGYKFNKSYKLRNKKNNFVQWFTFKIDKEINEFVLQEEEVEEIKFFKKEELIKEIEKNPKKFTSSVIKNINIFN
jgi:isopentenyl-diphosphate Delta-isomerase